MQDMQTPTRTADLQSEPDPQQARSGGTVPANIGQVLHVVRILLGYGRHLADTLEHRAAARGFSVIAQCFGTAKVSVIIAHLYRGIMRAVALERVLLARAAIGRDLTTQRPRTDAPREAPPTPEPGTEPQAALASATRTAARPRAHPASPDAPLDFAHLPTMAQLEAEVRRRPIGRVIAEICQHLGVAPRLCAGGFWNDIFDAPRCHRGNLVRLSDEMRCREVRFEQELDRQPSLGRPEEGREAIRGVLGFLVGEPSVDPRPALATACQPASAAALRPP
jgi:hypothetical protein